MAHPKLLSSADILETAMRLMEHAGAEGLSLRAVASELGVKAPSLYRYFPDKEAMELALAEMIWNLMLEQLREASETSDAKVRFRAMADAYLSFARERFSLYSFVLQNRPERYGSKTSKAVWNLLLDAASCISGQPDDTATTVAFWSFLHGYATLEHSGAFGASGPKGGLERGIEAFLGDFRKRAPLEKKCSKQSAEGLRGTRKS